MEFGSVMKEKRRKKEEGGANRPCDRHFSLDFPTKKINIVSVYIL